MKQKKHTSIIDIGHSILIDNCQYLACWMLICCNMHLDLQSITAATPFRHLNSISLTKLVYHHYQPVAFSGGGMRGARYFFPYCLHIIFSNSIYYSYENNAKGMESGLQRRGARKKSYAWSSHPFKNSWTRPCYQHTYKMLIYPWALPVAKLLSSRKLC